MIQQEQQLEEFLDVYKRQVLPAWDDVIANYATNTPRVIAWVNSNDIALEGGNLSLTNMYHHTSAFTRGIVINTGKIQDVYKRQV